MDQELEVTEAWSCQLVEARLDTDSISKPEPFVFGSQVNVAEPF